jgi:hypothetical protein
MYKKHGQRIVDHLLNLCSSFSIVSIVTTLSPSWGLAACSP